VRLAILISCAAFGATLAAWADGPLIPCMAGSHPGYLVPESYANAHKAALTATIPGPVKIDSFWTPTEADAFSADRVFRELIEAAVKDPTQLFPDLAPSADAASAESPDSLEHQQKELVAVDANFDAYARQYVGIIVDGQRLVFCNYSVGTKIDPASRYIFIDDVFVPDGTIRFLQCRFDPEARTCSNVSMIGSWQPAAK
jgi:hypothetical protein